jgi:hypothetical protein
MTDFADDALALLRSLHRDFDVWIVKRVGVKGYMWCAKRESDGTTVNADGPAELVEAIRQLETD